MIINEVHLMDGPVIMLEFVKRIEERRDGVLVFYAGGDMTVYPWHRIKELRCVPGSDGV